MNQLPSSLPNELRKIFDSSNIDGYGTGPPFGDPWRVSDIGFKPNSNGSVLELTLSSSELQDISVTIDANDIPDEVVHPNRSRLSNIGFVVSILLQEEVFSWEPRTIQGRSIRLGKSEELELE